MSMPVSLAAAACPICDGEGCAKRNGPPKRAISGDLLLSGCLLGRSRSRRCRSRRRRIGGRRRWVGWSRRRGSIWCRRCRISRCGRSRSIRGRRCRGSGRGRVRGWSCRFGRGRCRITGRYRSVVCAGREDEIGDHRKHQHNSCDQNAAAAAAGFDTVDDTRIIRGVARFGGERVGACRWDGVQRIRMPRIRYASGIGHGGSSVCWTVG